MFVGRLQLHFDDSGVSQELVTRWLELCQLKVERGWRLKLQLDGRGVPLSRDGQGGRAGVRQQVLKDVTGKGHLVLKFIFNGAFLQITLKWSDLI